MYNPEGTGNPAAGMPEALLFSIVEAGKPVLIIRVPESCWLLVQIQALLPVFVRNALLVFIVRFDW